MSDLLVPFQSITFMFPFDFYEWSWRLICMYWPCNVVVVVAKCVYWSCNSSWPKKSVSVNINGFLCKRLKSTNIDSELFQLVNDKFAFFAQTLQDELSGAQFHPLDDNLVMTYGKSHLAFWTRRKDGFFERTDLVKPVNSFHFENSMQ